MGHRNGKVKVCMLVIQHPFVDARIFKREAKSLVKAGYDVTLVVPRNKNGFLYDIDGTPYTDKFLEPKFMHEGITFVTYHPVVPSQDYMKNAINSKEYDLFKDPLFQTGLAQKADIYHVHEVLSLYSGIGIKRAMKNMYGKNVTLIYDSHEITEGSAEYVALFKQMVKEADCVIAVSDSMWKWYAKSFPSLTLETLYNSPPLDPAYKPRTFSSSSLVAGYIGYMSKDRGNQEKMYGIIEHSKGQMDLKFKVLGGVGGRGLDIPDSLKDNVIPSGWIHYEQIPRYIEDVDIGWIDYNLDSAASPFNFKIALPNKFFSYLNSGIPVVVNNCPEMASFISANECGLIVEGNNPSPQEYAKAFLYLNNHRKLLSEMSKNARKVMEKTYSWDKMEKRLHELYEDLLKAKRR
jgi:glycosyltransferase involved in cell wall biosynthesis